MLKWGIPLVVFALLVGFFAIGLTRDPREVPSPLIGKPAPQFQLTRLHEPSRTFGPEEMRGKVWLLNVWASWCVSCRVEHPVLVEMSRRNLVPIVGLDYKDQRADGLKWLTTHGDPYVLSAFDDQGKVGIDFGVYGVPETFVIDQQGVIRYKQIGPITPEALQKKILPLVKELEG
ncbi:MAG TPA: DsbE family thiol:disulfide interchange protein [Usitatibacter sp.]|jgi:cytochrome c biogenesis protein CcmG/thiol:disulfide interchange protein DsbE|nr:DsbE family thiol:disulfide interchange protein [Usitatibacter sp.]